MMSSREKSALPNEVVEFISQRMKIDTSSLLDKFDEFTAGDDRRHLEDALARFACLVIGHEVNGGIRNANPWDSSPTEVAIYNSFCELSSDLYSAKARDVMDSLRHAFCNYASGGLHQLFTGQECEGWYPTVVLDEVLNPNDIDTLPENVELYRGTSVGELRGRTFGQSWSTCENVAHGFAFVHYAHEPCFNKNERVVLKAAISKDNVYFSDQSNYEREVVVNVHKLYDVAIASDVTFASDVTYRE
jgi:hypothetical protein